MTEQFNPYAGQDTPAPAAAPTAPPAAEGRVLEASDDLLSAFFASAEKSLEPVRTFPIPGRAGWVADFHCIIDEADLKRYQRGATSGKAKGGSTDNVHTALMASTLLSEKCRGIFRANGDGTYDQVLVDGEPLVFSSEAFRKSQLAPGALDTSQYAVLKHYMTDPGLITLQNAVLRAAGWAEDLEPLDPTNA